MARSVPSSPVELPPVLTMHEVAHFLRVDRKTAYAMAKRGKLPGVRRVGRVVRVSRDALLSWLRAEHPHHQKG